LIVAGTLPSLAPILRPGILQGKESTREKKTPTGEVVNCGVKDVERMGGGVTFGKYTMERIKL